MSFLPCILYLFLVASCEAVAESIALSRVCRARERGVRRARAPAGGGARSTAPPLPPPSSRIKHCSTGGFCASVPLNIRIRIKISYVLTRSVRASGAHTRRHLKMRVRLTGDPGPSQRSPVVSVLGQTPAGLPVFPAVARAHRRSIGRGCTSAKVAGPLAGRAPGQPGALALGRSAPKTSCPGSGWLQRTFFASPLRPPWRCCWCA